MSSPYNGPERIVSLSERQAIVAGVLSPSSPLTWEPGGEWAYIECPGVAMHNNGSGRRDCRVYAIEAPGRTLKPPGCYCLHTSCASVLAEVNRRIRSAIGKAKADVGNGAKQAPGPSSPSFPGNGKPTPRTPDFKAPPRGDEATGQTARTGISKPLERFARAQVRAQSSQDTAFQPSGVSVVAPPEPEKPQPVAHDTAPDPMPAPVTRTEDDEAWAIRTGREPRAPRAAPTAPEMPPAGEKSLLPEIIPSPYETTPCPKKLDAAFITPTGVERGRTVQGAWVAHQFLPFEK